MANFARRSKGGLMQVSPQRILLMRGYMIDASLISDPEMALHGPNKLDEAYTLLRWRRTTSGGYTSGQTASTCASRSIYSSVDPSGLVKRVLCMLLAVLQQ